MTQNNLRTRDNSTAWMDPLTAELFRFCPSSQLSGKTGASKKPTHPKVVTLHKAAATRQGMYSIERAIPQSVLPVHVEADAQRYIKRQLPPQYFPEPESLHAILNECCV